MSLILNKIFYNYIIIYISLEKYVVVLKYHTTKSRRNNYIQFPLQRAGISSSCNSKSNLDKLVLNIAVPPTWIDGSINTSADGAHITVTCIDGTTA